MRTLFLILFLTVATSAQDLGWLSGHWATDYSEEVWSESREGNLMGYNRQIKGDKGDGDCLFVTISGEGENSVSREFRLKP